MIAAPGAPLKKALLDKKIGKDILGSYDNGVYQPLFSIIAKNSNTESKEEFLRVIEKVLKEPVSAFKVYAAALKNAERNT